MQNECVAGQQAANGTVCNLAPLSICLSGACAEAVCGDGFIGPAEMCDDGGTSPADGCSTDCLFEDGWICTGTPSTCEPICGDGLVRPGEECDDGNGAGGGCSSACLVELGWACLGEPSACHLVTCGDGYSDAPEVCDDGFTDACGTCNEDCSAAGQAATCGDGTVCEETESCDDGFTDACGTCNTDCSGLGSGSTCGDGVRCPETEVCDDGVACGCAGDCLSSSGSTCGDGLLCARTETCDDGFADSCGSCNATCDGAGAGSTCNDGHWCPETESCDDGNQTNGDGCNTDCTPSCSVDADCADGNPCTVPTCDVANGTCLTVFADATTVCRAATSSCDLPELCSGTASDCPADLVEPAGTLCDDGNLLTTGDDCDDAGACAGTLPPGSAFVRMAAGALHTCGVATDGGVFCWGDNTRGQLGDGTTADRGTPVEVQGLSGPATAVSAGEGHSCALLGDGSVACWGRNGEGQLGTGDQIDSSTAVAVRGLGSSAIEIAAGALHTCAILDTTGVACWGSNAIGQLGDGTTESRSAPVDVLGLVAGATKLAAGRVGSCAIMDTGMVRCWGDDTGDGTFQSSSIAVLTEPLGAAAVDISRGQVSCRGCSPESTFAVLETGLVKRWDGAVGRVDGVAGAVRVSAGYEHTCYVLDNLDLFCRGWQNYGQLGNGYRLDEHDEYTVLSGVAAVAAGEQHTCALLTDGQVSCWGSYSHGQLGTGLVGTGILSPVGVVGTVDYSVELVAAGSTFSCAVSSSFFAPYCWGRGAQGRRGNDDDRNSESASPVSLLPAGGMAIAAGGRHACVVTDAGALYCWGGNSWGQLGDGTVTLRPTPVLAQELESGVSQVAVSLDLTLSDPAHTCALLDTGVVECWGGNSRGQLGNGTYADSVASVSVQDLSSLATAVTAGAEHTCALLDTGAVECWGLNASGQLGDTVVFDSPLPRSVSGLASLAIAVSAGRNSTCAALDTGDVQCWGESPPAPPVGEGPTTIAGLSSDAVDLSCGNTHCCALLDTGGVQCWGSGARGRLGDGSTSASSAAVTPDGLASGVLSVSAGMLQTCAAMASGEVRCWGSDDYGETTGRFSGWPQPIIGP